jgi:hypothetical protein
MSLRAKKLAGLSVVAACAAVLALLSLPLRSAAPEAGDAQGEPEVFLVGPWSLTDLWEKGNTGRDFGEDAGTREAEIRKALGKSKLYIIDKRVRNEGKWVFTKEAGFPKVSVSGTVGYQRFKKDFSFHLKETSLALPTTRNDVKRPFRAVGVGCDFDLSGKVEGGKYQRTTGHSIRITYYADGKHDKFRR